MAIHPALSWFVLPVALDQQYKQVLSSFCLFKQNSHRPTQILIISTFNMHGRHIYVYIKTLQNFVDYLLKLTTNAKLMKIYRLSFMFANLLCMCFVSLKVQKSCFLLNNSNFFTASWILGQSPIRVAFKIFCSL